MRILLQQSYFTKILLLIPFTKIKRIHKRFYPKNRDVGHASKILNAARTPSTGLPPTSPQAISYPKPMTSIPSQTPTTPSLSKCHAMDQNKAAQKMIKDVTDHQVFAQKYTAKKDQPQTEFDINDITLPQTSDILTKRRILTQNFEYDKKLIKNDTPKVDAVKIEESQKDITEISPSEDLIGIRLPILQLPTQSNNAKSPINFNQEISQKYQEREQRSEDIMKTINNIEIKQASKNQQNLQIISQLMKYNLLKFDENTGERLIKECFLTWKKIYEKTTTIMLSQEIKDYKFDFGLLKVHNKEETLLLTGLQKHVIVLYITLDNQKIVWGYLTSEKGKNNEVLSNYQPFVNCVEKKKYQYVYPIKQPIMVYNSDIKQLPEELRVLGQKYLEDENVKQNLVNCFNTETVPLLKNSIDVYDGKGLTEENLKEILSHYIKRENKLGLKWFNEFKCCTTEKQKKVFWNDRKNDKNTHIRAHEYLNEAINHEKTKSS